MVRRKDVFLFRESVIEKRSRLDVDVDLVCRFDSDVDVDLGFYLHVIS